MGIRLIGEKKKKASMGREDIILMLHHLAVEIQS